MRRFAFLLILFAALAAPPARADEPSDTQLLDAFYVAALGSSSGRPGDEPRLVRWTVPVRIGLMGLEAGEATLGVLREQIERLRVITGHDLQQVRDGGANVVVMFAEDPFADVEKEPYRGQLLPLFQRDPAMPGLIALARGSAPCFAFTLRGNNERPAASLVGLSTRSGPAEMRTCIVKLLPKVLGLGGLTDAFWSVTAAGFRHADLPNGDVRMLKLLYSPKLTQGMTLSEVKRLAPTVLKELPAAN
ncbi:MAG: DUF2927 domain-containing protein [Alphaproteobacteria bacterium]|nr:DUF2927 domain-containing protein [Alphaproteobacteria bacterium]